MSVSSVFASPNFLRQVLRFDALSCLACGLLQLAFLRDMTQLLGLPAGLLSATGSFLLVFGVAVAWLSTREAIPRAAVWLVVAGNLGWAVACVVLLAGGVVSPTRLGVAYVALQALTVGLLAELQYFGLRRSAPAPAW